MHTFVKLSGVRTPELMALVPEGGAAGLYVDPGSPRSVDLEMIPALLDHLPKETEAWAIVSDPSTELVHALFETGVDRLQVYGTVPSGLEFLEIHSIVPSLPIPRAGVGGEEPKVPPAEDYSRLHLDSGGPPALAGSVERCDWEMCARLVDTNPGRKLTLAGGLDPSNIGEAIATVHPWGVDLTSWAERAPGEIDPAKVKAFLEAVVAAETPA